MSKVPALDVVEKFAAENPDYDINLHYCEGKWHFLLHDKIGDNMASSTDADLRTALVEAFSRLFAIKTASFAQAGLDGVA